MNPEEIFKYFGPLNYDDFKNLFLGSQLDDNRNHLLLLKFRKIVGDETTAQFVMRDNLNCEIYFDEQELDMVFDGRFSNEHFSQKEILNIFLRCNHKLIDNVLKQNLFEKIYIINDVEDFEKEALNIKEGSALSFFLLEKKDLIPQIFIKNLVNRRGKVNIKHLDYLEKCLYLLNNDDNKFEDKECLKFMTELDVESLKKIMTKFNLSKYLFRLVNCEYLIQKDAIEKLIFINRNLIDMDILYIILDNYYSFKNENEWLQRIFKENEICFSNYEIALWIIGRTEIYNYHYSNIEEFHQFCFPEKRIYELFFNSEIFIEKLAEPSHLIQFLSKNFDALIKKNSKILPKAIDYVFKYTNHSSFKQILENPENLLLKLNKIKTKLAPQIDQNLELIIKFKSHNIKTSLKELLNAETWDDLSDFYNKLNEGLIKIDDVINLKLKKMGEILKSKKILNGSIQCCICLEFKENLYIFQECSHFICLYCVDNYIKRTLNYPVEGKRKENKVFYKMNWNNPVPCPTCRKDNVVQNEMTILKIFI